MKKPILLPPERVSSHIIASRLVEATASQISQNRKKKMNLVWLELNGCSGNIISMMNGENPDFEYMLTSMIRLVYSNSLMVSEGEQAIEKLYKLLKSDEEFILAVEGAVATKNNGRYNIIGRYNDDLVTGLELVKKLEGKAKYVVAVGACAVDGGVSAAHLNPSQSVGVQNVLARKVIKLTGCPVHPAWFIGTLAHLISYGEPQLDDTDRPLLFYSTLIHDRCPRRTFFDKGIFAKKLGDKECLFKLGCRGPVTRTDCATRQWNGHTSWPIGANTPCIGCAQFGFPDRMEPFVSFDTLGDDKK